MRPPTLRNNLVPVNHLVIVGIDEPVDDSNAQWYDDTAATRVLDNEARFNSASPAARESWRQLLESLKVSGLIQPITVDIVKTKNDDGTDDYKAYVISGRRRAGAFRELTRQDPERFGQISAVTLASDVDRTTATLTENTVRADYTFEQQVAIATRWMDRATGDGSDLTAAKKTIASALAVSPNHIDKLRRLGHSSPGLLRLAVDEVISNGVAFEFSFMEDDHIGQMRAVNTFVAWRDAGYCEKRGAGMQHLQKAKDFCDALRKLRGKGQPIDVYLDQVNADIKLYLFGDEARDHDVPTIDDLPPDGEAPAKPVGATETVNSEVIGTVDTLPAEEDVDNSDAKSDADEPDFESLPTIAGVPIVPSTRPAKKRLENLFDELHKEDVDGYAHVQDFESNPMALQVLTWIVTGTLPSERTKDNAALCDLLAREYPAKAKHLLPRAKAKEAKAANAAKKAKA